MRTIFIRFREEEGNYKVVVKPHPGSAGINALQLATHEEAHAHADKLRAEFGWPVVEEL